METSTVGGVTLGWDPATRLVSMRHEPGRRQTETDARAIISVLEGWVGEPAAPFRFLVDASGMGEPTVGYRSAFADFFRRHRAHVRLAVYNTSTLVRVLLVLFTRATRIDARAFATEAEARAWLSEWIPPAAGNVLIVVRV